MGGLKATKDSLPINHWVNFMYIGYVNQWIIMTMLIIFNPTINRISFFLPIFPTQLRTNESGFMTK